MTLPYETATALPDKTATALSKSRSFSRNSATWAAPAGFIRDSDGSFRGVGLAGTIDPRCHTLTCLLFALAVTSAPTRGLTSLALLAAFPAFTAASAGIPFTFVAARVLPALPLGIMMGTGWMFLYRDTTAILLGFKVSHGMVAAAWICLRMSLTVAACAILAACSGMRGILAALAWWRVPDGFLIVLSLVHRYSLLILEEVERIMTARWCRVGPTPLAMADFKTLAGSLLRRSVSRGHRISMAMRARGIDNPAQCGFRERLEKWRRLEWFFLLGWGAYFAAALRIGGAL